MLRLGLAAIVALALGFVLLPTPPADVAVACASSVAGCGTSPAPST